MTRNTFEAPQGAELIAEVHREISETLDKYLPANIYVTLGLTEYQMEEVENVIYSYVWEDLLSMANRDPAAKTKAKYVLDTYSTFRAVMYYRIANTICYYRDLNEDIRLERARKISEDAKVKTGIEIHPAARIGKRFVIDHGYGTVIGYDFPDKVGVGDTYGNVIGETCIIEDDCYILQGAILGSRGIADNIARKRHPTIGNWVEIGAFARILGPVTIGDGVSVAPHCVITQNILPKLLFSVDLEFQSDLDGGIVSTDLRKELEKKGISLSQGPTVKEADNRWLIRDRNEKYIVRKEEGGLNIYLSTKVNIVNQLQMCTPPVSEKVQIYGVVPEDNGRISIHGCNFTKNLSALLVDDKLKEIGEVEISVISNEDNCIRLQLSLPGKNIAKEKLQKAKITIINDEDIITITQSSGLRKVIDALICAEGGA